jgi:undecaprenyl phosphate-alpha-L-ara4N flippase subunit ArnF
MSDARTRHPAVTLFLNAYVQIALGAVMATASEILMKAGANTVMIDTAATSGSGAMGWLGIAALASGRTWLGIICYILSFLSWIYVLRTIPLGIAFAMISVVHVLIPIGCWIFLQEAISPMRWGGIGLVIVGLLLLVGPVARAEAKL